MGSESHQELRSKFIALDVMAFVGYSFISILLILFVINSKILRGAPRESGPQKRSFAWTNTAAVFLVCSLISLSGLNHLIHSLRVSNQYIRGVQIAEVVLVAASALLSVIAATIGIYIGPALIKVANSFELNTEGELKQLEEEQNKILDLFEESIVVLNSTGTEIMSGNNVTTAFLGMDFLGGSVTKRIHPDDVSSFSHFLRQSSTTESPVVGSTSILTNMPRRRIAASTALQYRIQSVINPGEFNWVESTIRKRAFSAQSRNMKGFQHFETTDNKHNRGLRRPGKGGGGSGEQLDDSSLTELDEETALQPRSITTRTASRVHPLQGTTRETASGTSHSHHILQRSSDDQDQFELVMITRDISERKKSEELQRLCQSQDQKDQVNAAKLRYISSIAHDLKTPLQSFSFAIDDLKASPLNEEQREVLGYCQTASDLMSLTITQTMDIGKLLTGGKLTPRRGTVELSALLKRVDVIIKSYGTQVPIYYSIAPDVGEYILSDGEWLWQMLLNLLTNASKYTDEGEIRVSISLRKALPPAAGLELSQQAEMKHPRISDNDDVPVPNLYPTPRPIDATDACVGSCSAASSTTATAATTATTATTTTTTTTTASDPMDRYSSLLKHRTETIIPGFAHNGSLEAETEELRGARTAAAVPMLLFEVADTGIGILDSKVDSLFQPFSMTQECQTTGTGLGLYGLRSRVTGLGGSCGVRKNSEAASGSVFWFEIPYIEDTTNAQLFFASRTVSESDLTKAVLPTKARRKSVLVSAQMKRDLIGKSGRGLVEGAFHSRKRSGSFREFFPSSANNVEEVRKRNEAMQNVSSAAATSTAAAAAASAASTSSRALTRSKSLDAAASRKLLSAIVVDDVLTIRKIMDKILKQLGFDQVDCYPNGKKGLDAMMAKEVDIVFSDVQMPVLTGPEMVQRFRQFEAEELKTGRRNHRQIIVAVTANGAEYLEDLVASDKFDRQLSKPVRKKDLRLVICELLGVSIETEEIATS